MSNFVKFFGFSGNVITNDSDAESNPLTVTEVNGNAADVDSQITLPSGALLTLNSDGTFDYDPNGQFESLNNGETDSDSFTYTIDDGNGGTDTATVNVTIDGVTDNTPPLLPISLNLTTPSLVAMSVAKSTPLNLLTPNLFT
ncbi:MAG: hypothetical protein F6K24_37205 [Okeania sp. SIO2D1]|nr:hypothetical protein [Okeania sp. SIO2D1]